MLCILEMYGIKKSINEITNYKRIFCIFLNYETLENFILFNILKLRMLLLYKKEIKKFKIKFHLKILLKIPNKPHLIEFDFLLKFFCHFTS